MNGQISGVHPMAFKAAFLSVGTGMQVNLMKVRQMDGDLIRWTDSVHSDTMLRIKNDANAMERHPVDTEVSQGSPLSLILFAIWTSGLIKWVAEYVSEAERLSFVHNLDWLPTGSDVNCWHGIWPGGFCGVWPKAAGLRPVACGPHGPPPAPMPRSRASPGSDARDRSPDVILGFAEYALSFPIYICLSFSFSLLFRQSLLYDSQFNISIGTRLISTSTRSSQYLRYAQQGASTG